MIYSDYYSEKTVKHRDYSYRVMNDETLSNLYDKVTKVASLNFSNVVEEEDIGTTVLLIHKKLLQMYNECYPIRTKYIEKRPTKSMD